MAVESFSVTRREPYADGQPFGEAGPFELIEGSIHYAIDPTSEPQIADLELVPPEPDGLVRFHGDFTLVAPADPSRCDTLLVDVPNRGRRLSYGAFNLARPAALLDDPRAPGDGFLFRHGIALASIGWEWGVANGLALDAPIPKIDGADIRGSVVCRIQPGVARQFVSFGQLGEVTYPPRTLDNDQATLYERDHDNAPLVPIDRSRWRFARERDGGIEPSERFVWLDGGFEPGRVYVLAYEAEGARVIGAGLLALRDAALALRSAVDSPLDRGFDSVLAFGASQTGRVLRQFVHDGLNTSSRGPAFDGVHIHIAGGQRGDFNHRFAQPSGIGTYGPGQRFPFAITRSRDPYGDGAEAGLFDRDPTPPKVVITNTSFEYWRGDAALSHTSADGKEDLPTTANERNYLFAGTHHVNGIFPPTNHSLITGEKTAHDFNTVNHSPLVRAALLNLRAWVKGTAAPPDSRIPRLADGTLTTRADVMAAFAARTDVKRLDPDKVAGLREFDLGARADEGVYEFPADEGRAYARLAPAVDETLNEAAGIRLPDIAAPIGFHTGWNPRHADHGGEDQAAIFMGISMFDRPEQSDDEYRRAVETTTDDLVEEGFVLAEDRDYVIKNAMRRFEYAKDHGKTK